VPLSHSRMMPSKEQEASMVPSHTKSTAVMGSLWAGSSRRGLPLRRSHRRTVSSKLPEACRVGERVG
jgi:hypothetical protein